MSVHMYAQKTEMMKMVRGLMQIKEQNDNACTVHEARKLGIVPLDHLEWVPLTVDEIDKLSESRKLMLGNEGLQAAVKNDR